MPKIIESDGIKVAIRRQPNSLQNEIYFFTKQGSHTVFLTFETKDGNTTVTDHRVEVGGQAIPCLVIPEYMTREIIQGFMAEGKGLGIKPPDESFAEGKLEAQGRHLEDLRKLLKL